MAEFLFEIFCEEIPARMQVRAGEDLSKALVDGLKKAGLTVEKEHCYTGPRRLVFTADIPLRSPDISEERKGPRVGSPEQALAGFMRGAGISDISEAQIRTDPKKGEFYVAVIEKSGEESSAIIADLIPAIMNNFPWPKSMKSGRSNFRWVRPLQSMVCLLDGKVVEFEVGGVATGNTTEGHRRHGKGPFTVKGFDDYRKQLEGKGHVMVCSCERKAKILEDARKACVAKGLELVEDEGLLNEVAGLAEWPVVILGDMDPSFLELPGEVIRLSMRTHQKYFAVRDPKTGKLAPNFIVVANQDAPDGGIEIAKGNSKVLSARLADAQFFQSEDAKKQLIEYYEKLDTVVFHKKLGSIKDKAERVAALAYELAPKLGADAEAAKQAAKLAKCDLVTNMVVEFTSLQGQIGAQMYRAEQSDEVESIAVAIEEHYKPQGPSDSVPTNPVAVTVALADKMDTLVGFWAIDEKPTGSKDPFALRRAALGLVRIILENNVRLKLGDLVMFHFVPFARMQIGAQASALKSDSVSLEKVIPPLADLTVDDYARNILSKIGSGRIFDEAVVPKSEDLLAFIIDRLKVYLREKGIRHDLIDAVFALGEDDLVAIVNRVEALQSFLGTSEGENLLAGYKRAANILKAEAKKGDLPSGEIGTLSQSEARDLQQSLSKAKPEIDAALASESYSTAMTALSELRGPIDAFFENVMVVAEDETERANNLRLLGMIRDTARQIADFELISG
ncbi:MAG: glycine--tRNA ligase subunit beta [Hellea sp.]